MIVIRLLINSFNFATFATPNFKIYWFYYANLRSWKQLRSLNISDSSVKFKIQDDWSWTVGKGVGDPSLNDILWLVGS